MFCDDKNEYSRMFHDTFFYEFPFSQKVFSSYLRTVQPCIYGTYVLNYVKIPINFLNKHACSIRIQSPRNVHRKTVKFTLKYLMYFRIFHPGMYITPYKKSDYHEHNTYVCDCSVFIFRFNISNSVFNAVSDFSRFTIFYNLYFTLPRVQQPVCVLSVATYICIYHRAVCFLLVYFSRQVRILFELVENVALSNLISVDR